MLTRYGTRELLLATGLCGAAAAGFVIAGAYHWAPLVWGAGLPVLVYVFVLYFFRDPERAVPEGDGILVAPADGVVTHVEEAEAPAFLGGRALRISVFLSVFDVHVNRIPHAGRVVHAEYRQGEFLNAMRADSGHRNEAMDLGMESDDPRLPRFLVRQIAGLIARCIVCEAKPGAELARGQRYGMMKFGSRTDLFLPAGTRVDIRVKVGDRVRGGVSVLGVLPGTGE